MPPFKMVDTLNEIAMGASKVTSHVLRKEKPLRQEIKFCGKLTEISGKCTKLESYCGTHLLSFEIGEVRPRQAS